MLRMIGVVLVVGGLVSLINGRIEWTDAVAENVQIPPLAGGIVLATGVVLLMSPRKRGGAF